MEAELEALSNRPGHLVEFYFDDETLRFTDFYFNVNWSGNDYSAAGHFIQFDGIEEGTELTIPKATIVLTGVDQSMVSQVFQKPYLNRRVVIRKAMADLAWVVVVDPTIIFDGEMKHPRIAEDPETGKCDVIIECSHEVSNFETPGGRRTTHEIQQLFFPGDGIFKYSSQSNRLLEWGG